MKSMRLSVAVLLNVLFLVAMVFPGPCLAADNSATKQASEAVNDSAQAVADGITTLQERISESSLVNRTCDENIAFILMGVLVASFAGMFSKIRASGMGIAGRLALGLGGAFIGGMVVRIAQIDFEWGTITMRYEELLFSLLGAVVIVSLTRLIRYQMAKNPKSK